MEAHDSTLSSCSSSLLTNDAVNKIESIDQELAKYDALMLNLKSQRNSVVPISRLPPEVLSTVFYFASRMDPRGIEWIRLSYVCRYWRDLALQTPSLWSNPPLQSRRWTEVMCIRSKEVGLTIQADVLTGFGHDTLKKVLDTILNNITRIKQIQIELGYNSTFLLEHLPSSVPKLESLVMKCHNNYTSFRIPDESLCDMDRLKRMELSGPGLQFNWDLHLPSTLTILKLHCLSSSTWKMEKILDALERMPFLQILDLIDVLPHIEKPSTPTRSIHLGKLQKLSLDARYAEAESLLRVLTFPPTTYLQILCEQVKLSDYLEATGIFPSFERSQKNEVQIKFLDLTLNKRSDDDLLRTSEWCIYASNVPNKPGNLDHHRTSFSMKMTLSWQLKQTTFKSGSVLRGLVQNLPLENVRNLSLRGSVEALAVRTLLDTVGALPRVRTLTIVLVPNVIRALKSHLYRVPGYSERPSQISFPSLRNLFLIGEFIEEFMSEPEDVTVEMLLDCLEWRSKCGSPVKWLNVEECKGIDRFEVDYLQDVVEEVVWDPDFVSDDSDEEVDLKGNEEDEDDSYEGSDEGEEEEEEDEEEDGDEEEDEPELGIDDLFDSDDPDIMGFGDFY